MRARAVVALVALIIAGCASGSDQPDEVVLMTHESFAVSDGVLEEFTAETGVTVTIMRAADAGTMVNQAILTKDNPVADVLYGIDNTFLSRALDASVFTEHRAVGIEAVPTSLRDPGNRVTPIDFGDVCLNTDIAGLEERGIGPPAALSDLTDPAYRGLLVVEDPSTSSPGLAFLLATIATFGENGDYPWRAFWQELVANDVRIVPGWDQAY